MSTTRPVIFISSVSKELRSARTLVATTLSSMGYDPKFEDTAATDQGDLLGILRRWIDESDAIIQLVGHCYGLGLKEEQPQFGKCSHTQYEAHYALQQGKKIYYILLEKGHPTDGCGCEPKTLHELQEEYRQEVKGYSDLYHPSASLDKTELLVRRMDDKLAELRIGDQERQKRLQEGMDAVITGISALNQQAQSLPPLAFTPQSWPQASPFHNRGFPDQKNFVGRAELLRDMKEKLDAGQDVALTQPVAMHGAGGIGKTRAAVEFVRMHGSSYTLRLFLDTQSPEALRASLVEVSRNLELHNDPQASADALVLLALRLLRAVPSALVVADNADTPSALAAVRPLCHEPGGVRWLITTRLSELGEEFATQRVDLLTEADAVQLLQQRGSRNGPPGTDAEARAIALELGCLPLALQQAAAYVAHNRLTWTAYIKLLADNPAQALSHDAVEMKDVPESILRTYTISLQQITPLARTLLEVAAHLAPAPIPEVVLLHEDDGSRRAALVELADLSLLEWQAGLLEVHRAITIAVCHDLGLGVNRRSRLEMACLLVTSYAPEETKHPNHWPVWAALRPHIEHLLARVGPAGAAEKTYVWLLATLPNYLSALGEYAAAAGFYRSAIACSQHILGAEHPSTLMGRNNLAVALRAQGKYAESEQEQRAVLQIKDRVLGTEHPDTLSSRNNLAVVLRVQGRNAEAEQEQRTVLKVQERVLGAEHPDTLSSRHNLALTLQAQGKPSEAEQENRAVLKIRACVLGTEHPDTLKSRNNLANTLDDQGRYAEAEQEQRAVLRIKERVLGAEHPSTLASRSNLAEALQSQGKHNEAEQEQWAVLKIRARVLGPEHPETLSSRMNLAKTLQSQGKPGEAEQEQRTVLEVQERVLGAEHPDVAMSCFNLAMYLEEQQNLQQALDFMQRAEQVFSEVLGSDHSHRKRAKVMRERIEAALKLDEGG